MIMTPPNRPITHHLILAVCVLLTSGTAIVHAGEQRVRVATLQVGIEDVPKDTFKYSPLRPGVVVSLLIAPGGQDDHWGREETEQDRPLRR